MDEHGVSRKQLLIQTVMEPTDRFFDTFPPPPKSHASSTTLLAYIREMQQHCPSVRVQCMPAATNPVLIFPVEFNSKYLEGDLEEDSDQSPLSHPLKQLFKGEEMVLQVGDVLQFDSYHDGSTEDKERKYIYQVVACRKDDNRQEDMAVSTPSPSKSTVSSAVAAETPSSRATTKMSTPSTPRRTFSTTASTPSSTRSGVSRGSPARSSSRGKGKKAAGRRGKKANTPSGQPLISSIFKVVDLITADASVKAGSGSIHSPSPFKKSRDSSVTKKMLAPAVTIDLSGDGEDRAKASSSNALSRRKQMETDSVKTSSLRVKQEPSKPLPNNFFSQLKHRSVSSASKKSAGSNSILASVKQESSNEASLHSTHSLSQPRKSSASVSTKIKGVSGKSFASGEAFSSDEVQCVGESTATASTGRKQRYKDNGDTNVTTSQCNKTIVKKESTSSSQDLYSIPSSSLYSKGSVSTSTRRSASDSNETNSNDATNCMEESIDSRRRKRRQQETQNSDETANANKATSTSVKKQSSSHVSKKVKIEPSIAASRPKRIRQRPRRLINSPDKPIKDEEDYLDSDMSNGYQPMNVQAKHSDCHDKKSSTIKTEQEDDVANENSSDVTKAASVTNSNKGSNDPLASRRRKQRKQEIQDASGNTHSHKSTSLKKEESVGASRPKRKRQCPRRFINSPDKPFKDDDEDWFENDTSNGSLPTNGGKDDNSDVKQISTIKEVVPSKRPRRSVKKEACEAVAPNLPLGFPTLKKQNDNKDEEDEDCDSDDEEEMEKTQDSTNPDEADGKEKKKKKIQRLTYISPNMGNIMWTSITRSPDPQVGLSFLNNLLSVHHQVPNSSLTTRMMEFIIDGPKDNGIGYVDNFKTCLVHEYLDKVMDKISASDHEKEKDFDHVSSSFTFADLDNIVTKTYEKFHKSATSKPSAKSLWPHLHESRTALSLLVKVLKIKFEAYSKEASDGTSEMESDFGTNNYIRESLKKVVRLSIQTLISHGCWMFDYFHNRRYLCKNDDEGHCARETKQCVDLLGQAVSYIAHLYCAKESQSMEHSDCYYVINDAVMNMLETIDYTECFSPSNAKIGQGRKDKISRKIQFQFMCSLTGFDSLQSNMCNFFGLEQEYKIMRGD